MDQHDELEIKKEFQLERVILFSDAVFAILITIMVIDLKLPENIKEMGQQEVDHAFKNVIFKFLGYAVSFFVVARFWTQHLKLFSFLKDYNLPLLAYNLFFLFCVSLFPFAVTLITGTSQIDSRPYVWGMNIYITVFFASTLAQSLLTRYLIKNKETMCFSPDKVEEVLRWKVIKLFPYLIGAFIIVLIILNLLNTPATVFIYIMAAFGVITSRIMKKMYPAQSTDSLPYILRIFRRRIKKPRQK